MQKKLKLHTALAVLLMGLVACQPANNAGSSTDAELPGEGRSVVPIATSIQEEKFQMEIVNIGLEALGYQIEVAKEADPTTMHLAIANADVDYAAAHWEKLHTKFFENVGGQEKIKRVGTLVANTLQGYQIDKATAERYNITNIEQLKNPEIAKLFDHDGDGKANLAGCIPGWGCELVIEHHLDAYDLRDTVEHDKGNYSILIGNIISRYKQGQPVLYYTWTPLWVATILKPGKDVTWLEVPYTDLPAEQKSLTEKDTSVDGKNLGFAIDRVKILANNEFLADNPSAERWFELIEIPIEDISAQNQLMKEGEDAPEDIRRHAEEWIKENQDLFDSLLAKAKEAAR